MAAAQSSVENPPKISKNLQKYETQTQEVHLFTKYTLIYYVVYRKKREKFQLFQETSFQAPPDPHFLTSFVQEYGLKNEREIFPWPICFILPVIINRLFDVLSDDVKYISKRSNFEPLLGVKNDPHGDQKIFLPCSLKSNMDIGCNVSFYRANIKNVKNLAVQSLHFPHHLLN